MIAFWILAVVLVASAVFTVTAKKPVYSVVGLLVNFIALAATYLTLQAEFLAVIQIVVYSGAILILFVFVIALLSSGTRPFEVTAFILMVAVIGVVLIAGDETPGEEGARRRKRRPGVREPIVKDTLVR